MSSSSRVTEWRPSALIGAVVCLCAAPRVQLFTIASNGWSRNVARYHQLMPISCHFRDCKALLFGSCKQRYNKYPDPDLLVCSWSVLQWCWIGRLTSRVTRDCLSSSIDSHRLPTLRNSTPTCASKARRSRVHRPCCCHDCFHSPDCLFVIPWHIVIQRCYQSRKVSA